jgi:uncharacterized membrane protein YfcA
MAFDLLVVAAGVVAGAIASISGFGIGSLLTPMLALAVDARVAVAAVAIPHVVGTGLRYVMLRVGPDRGVLWTFGAASAAGALAGALLQPATSSRGLLLLFGSLLLFVATSEWTGLARRMRFTGPLAWIAGALSGLLGGLVGNQGGIRSAALLGFNLNKEVFVATATAIALVIDGVRLPIYLWFFSEDVLAEWRLVVAGTIGVLLGTVVGSRLLRKVPDRWFRPAVAVLLAFLGISMLLRGLISS